MKKVLQLLIFVASFTLSAQNFTHSIKEGLLTFTGTDKVTSLTVTNNLKNDYIISAKKIKEENQANKKIQITLTSSDNTSEIFILYPPLSYSFFKSKFKKYYLKLIEKAENIDIYKATIGFDEGAISILFSMLTTAERTSEERPTVANISLKNDIIINIDNNKKEKLKNPKLEMTFFNGFIEKIELEGIIFNRKVRLSNTYSIGISSRKSIRKLANNNLLSDYNYTYKPISPAVAAIPAKPAIPAVAAVPATSNSPAIPAKPAVAAVPAVSAKAAIAEETFERDGSGSGLQLSISVADVIDYDRELEINGNDISPVPTKIVLDEVKKESKLYREESTRLIEATVYSDLQGIRDEGNPNGIIQTEISKRFFINTNRDQLEKGKKWYTDGKYYLIPPFFPSWFSDAVGGFEYLDLTATLSKIEENNKFLESNSINGESFYEPIRIMQHQSFSAGANLNLLYFESQNNKINTNLDLGLHYGISNLQITEDVDKQLNTISPSLELGFQFISEHRYGLYISNRLSYYQINGAEDITLKSIDDGKPVSPNFMFNKTKFEFFLNLNSNGKIFLRYQLFSELEDWDNNFSQVQVGYSFYILRQNGSIN